MTINRTEANERLLALGCIEGVGNVFTVDRVIYKVMKNPDNGTCALIGRLAGNSYTLEVYNTVH